MKKITTKRARSARAASQPEQSHGGARRGAGRPRRTGIQEMIAIRWPAAIIRAIDTYAEEQALNRSVALRQIVIKALAAEGRVDIKSVLAR